MDPIKYAALAMLFSQAVSAAPEDWRRIDTIPTNVKSVTTSTPIFSQVVVFGLPSGWKPAHENATETNYIMEFIPKDQTLQVWSDMITVQGFRNLAQNPKATPVAFLSVLAGRVKQTCGEQFVVHSLGDRKIDSFDAHAAIMGCASMQAPAFGAKAGQGEIAFYIAIKGTNDLYLVHRAMRGNAFDKNNPPMAPANAEGILRSLQPIKICERSEAQSQCWERGAR
jgi:hypothetical protein